MSYIGNKPPTGTAGEVSEVTTPNIAAGAVTTTRLADGAVTTIKITDANVTTAKIADSNVTANKIASNAVTTVKIADSNVTTAKIADGAVSIDKITDGILTYAKMAAAAFASVSDNLNGTASRIVNSAILLSTLRPFDQTVVTTSGTSALFTSIPTNIRRIVISLNQVSSSSASRIVLQLGTGGTIEATGYVGSCTIVSTTVGNSSNSIDFGIVNSLAATDVMSGIITLTKVDDAANGWSVSGGLATSTGATLQMAGYKALAGAIDRLQIVAGAGAFDNGKIRVEGYYF